MGKSIFVYIKDKDYGWIPAIQTSDDGKKAQLKVPQYADEQSIISDGGRGAKKKVDKEVFLKDYLNNVLPLQNVDANGCLIEFADMVELPFLHEAAILYNLKKRHKEGKPYTRTGDIIIAINPFQWFTELYTDKQRVKYSNKIVWENHGETDPRKFVEPHVYETSALCYKGLHFTKVDQSILVSGESGAGKTETVKIAMNHMASVQRGKVQESGEDKFEDPVVNRVLQSNPLLEAFGNAKTVRNDNSSRFGKYCQLQFDCSNASRSILAGSYCEAYLLEKNRITGHEGQERTYHIFYQVIAAPEAEKKAFWSGMAGTKFDSFKYVGNTKTLKIEKMTDGQHFVKTLETLKLINLGGDKLKALMRAIIAVMQCGNLTFGALNGDSEKSECTSKKELSGLADLIGCSEAELNLAFTERTMKTMKETYKVPLTVETAKESCDAFAKEVYGKLFLWLVDGINEATKAENNYTGGNGTYGIIGLLDIFGFESFVVNRFEQLCINYANEKLQQKFTEDIFRSVQAEYEAEGIELAEITYDDNGDVLALIEGRTGLCALLNEECILPKGKDEAFVNKAISQNKKSPCLVANKMDRMGFGIHHFAGKVMYSAEFFVQRNLDNLPSDLEDLMFQSTNFIIAKKPVEPKTAGKAPKKKKSSIVGDTIWSKYKTQLAKLMSDLRKTNSRYIRCLKPNKAKVPVKMDHIGTVEQLRCAGVVAAVTITRSAFPNRLDNSAVGYRFGAGWDVKKYPSKKTNSMSKEEQLKWNCDAMMECCLKEREIDGKKQYVVGKTRTYFRAGALEFLEANRAAGLEGQAISIQRFGRGYIVRQKMKALLKGKNDEIKAEKKQREGKREKRREQFVKEKEKREEVFKRGVIGKEAEKVVIKEKIVESDKVKEIKVQQAKVRVKTAETQTVSYQEKTSDSAKKLILEPKKQAAAAKKRVESNTAQINDLKKVNKRLKKENDKVGKQFKELKKNNKKLMKTNQLAGGNFEDENSDLKEVHDSNEDFLDKLDASKDKNRDLKADCQEKQKEYMSVAESRLEFQKTLGRILTLIQDNCDDRHLIQETQSIALDCETESKSIMAELEAETEM